MLRYPASTCTGLAVSCLLSSPAVVFSCFFFLIIRPPPRSTLFPTRRSSDLGKLKAATAPRAVAVWLAMIASARLSCRSEEHTSELQSLRHLVCRLLLEKKKRLCAQSQQHNNLPMTPSHQATTGTISCSLRHH